MPSFTPNESLQLVFSPHLLPGQVQAELPSTYHVRSTRGLYCFFFN